jgi:hypothetical protein
LTRNSFIQNQWLIVLFGIKKPPGSYPLSGGSPRLR